MMNKIDLSTVSAELKGAASNLVIIGNLFDEDQIIPTKQTIQDALFAVSRLLDRTADDLLKTS